MYTIRKEFSFSAMHTLIGLSKGHPCGREHGHNYVIIVELKHFELNPDGFVRDYGELAPIKHFIEERLDHDNLNNSLQSITGKFVQPSAENIAKVLFDEFIERYPELNAIEVMETPKTTARYER